MKNSEQRITILITGLSGIGKSRLAHRIQKLLIKDITTQGILRECGTSTVDIFSDERGELEVRNLVLTAKHEGKVTT